MSPAALSLLARRLVLAVSSDLPFGTLASPGAGMLPMLLVAPDDGVRPCPVRARRREPAFRARSTGTIFRTPSASSPSPRLAAAALHAARLSSPTMALLLLVLIVARAQRPLLPAAAFSIGVTCLAYTLFSLLLKSPLPRGIIGF